MPTPIKRHPSLIPISREHHHGLLLSWKIREGFKKEIDLKRIKKYVDWFYKNYLVPHNEFEERYIYPILGKKHPLINKALEEHQRLESLFKANDELEKNLSSIEEELVAHIRFEERILFKEIQNVANEKQLKIIEESYVKQEGIDDYPDEFWI